MASYFNNNALVELFATVESKRSVDDRLKALTALRQEFISLTVTSLERVCFDLAEQGWTAKQIGDEIGLGRHRITKMAGAYAKRTGHLSPFPYSRDYEEALDISRLVQREAKQRAPRPKER